VTTLVSCDIFLSFAQERWKRVHKLTGETPVVIIQDGVVLEERMRKERVDLHDVLSAARHSAGLSRLDQLDYVVVESTGLITVVPKRGAGRTDASGCREMARRAA
jgi:uncharacterized membrane protein YcaP (DUF421 family)